MKIKNCKAIKNGLFFIALLSLNLMTAQQTTSFDRLNVKSPAVTDIIRYGNIEASYYTGAIDLRIPLLSVQNNNQAPVDISMVYNSSGFMPVKRSGIVGLNWALNAGGVITRKINGVPDDYVGFPTDLSPSATGVFPTNGFIIGIRKNQIFAVNDVFNFSSATGFQHTNLQWMLGTAGSTSAYEGTPDVFEFNFNGISGKFHMGNDGKIKVVTKQSNNLIVDVTGLSQQNGTSCAPTPSEIKITDNQGNQYFFGGSLNNLEYTIPLGDRYTRYVGIKTQPIITSWFLRKIVYANLSEVIFTNRTDTLIPDDLGDGPTSNITANRDFICLNQYISQQKNFSELNVNFSGQNLQTYSSSAASGVRSSYEFQKKVILDKIEGDNFIITFNYSPQLSKFNRILPAPSIFEYEEIKLDNIKLTDKTANIVKSIDFSYNYFGGTYNRMFLETVAESGKTPYKFEYTVTDNLPDPSTRGVDYWGFWNGLDAQTTLLPQINYTVSEDFTYTSSTREPSFDKAKQGLLAKVIYPSGGYSKFDFEAHSYSQFLERPSINKFLPTLSAKNGTAGGARIAKITDFDGTADTNIRTFKYLKNYSPAAPLNTLSSGILMNWPRYAIHYDTYNNGTHTSNVSIQSSSVNTGVNDNLITYSEVAELTNGKGYTLNKFKDYSLAPDLDVNNKIIYNGFGNYGAESNIKPLELFKNHPGVMLDDRSEERGKLISVKMFDDLNNLKAEEIYTYNNSPNRFDRFSVSIHQTGVWSQSNRLYFYNDYLSQKTSIVYNNNTPKVSSVESFEYGTGILADNLVSKSVTKSETGGTLTSKNFYPHDPLMASEPFDAQLIAKNIIGIPLKTESHNENVKLSESITKYGSFSSAVSGQSLLLPQYIYSKKGNVVPDQLEKKVTYDKYDALGNITQYTVENGIPVSVLWGYNKTLPVAKIENATNSQLAVYLKVTDLSSLNETNLAAVDGLRTNTSAAGCMITTYVHKPLVGVSRITDPKGISTNYEYDSSGRLMFILDNNLNILQRYCYGYKGQQVDCSADNPYGVSYKSTARSGSFTKNNCSAGQSGSSVAYSQAAGAAVSSLSQADADAKGLALFNANGQANANASGTCIFNSAARSGSFTRNNCGTGTGSSVSYSQAAGAATSAVSQADADAKGLVLFNTGGQANANALGICTYSSAAESGSFTKGGCPSGASGSSVVYSQAAGAVTSTISQADADNLGHDKFVSAGRQYANLTGTCLYNSIAYSDTFYRQNCPEGQYGSGVLYSQPAGAATGTTQAAADEAGLAKFNADGLANANLNGTCTQMITYQYGWASASKTLAIVAKAVSNPTGYTLRFNLVFAEGYNLEPRIVEINMAQGQLSKTGTFVLPAPVQSVQLVTIWKN